jgi:DNA-binding winged helix-turn-helix (wHTH) protein
MPRYRFAQYTVSPRRRMLLCDGREQPLIPRYFDLLVFLIERRREAVHRREIFDGVWRDVIVSDSALSQAIRTIRRVLDDDPREPRFIRTVSRHGYRFVYDEVIEEDEDAALAATGLAEAGSAIAHPVADPSSTGETAADPFEPLIARVVGQEGHAGDDEERREAAELLHALGTAEALRRLGTRPGHAGARALLRDTRWDVAGAGDVPILGQPGALAAGGALVRLRLRRAARLAARRWAAASVGGGLAGLIAGAIGGLILANTPGSAAPLSLAAVLGGVGALCGAAGGAGVGAGLAVAETVARSRRTAALIIGAAAGGGLVGAVVQLMGRWTLAALVGLDLAIGGSLEGLAIGSAAGVAYALSAPRGDGGMAAPRGRRRVRVAAATALACGAAALAVTLTGRPLVGGTIHEIARASGGGHASLTPLARLIGEPDFGRLSASLLGTGEGALFGLGLALGVTRRPGGRG